MKILVKFPSRQRPKQFLTALAKAINNQTTENVQYLVSYDLNDLTFNSQLIELVESKFDNVKLVGGNSTGKIHACNRDLATYKGEWDIVVLMSDDMICQVKGWDGILIQEMKDNFPDTDGVLWHNDGFTQDTLNTMCILGKAYYKRFGYIYHPSYQSLWSDNQFMEVATILNRQKYFPEVLFKHVHPANSNEAINDSLYLKNDSLYLKDKKTYEKQKSVNFSLSNEYIQTHKRV